MITTAVIFFALFFLSVVTLLSIFEMSLSRISKVTLRRLVEKHKSKKLEQLKALADNRLESLISVYVGIQVCMVGFAILTTGYLHNRLQSYAAAMPAAFGIMFAVVVIFRQLIPRLFTFRKARTGPVASHSTVQPDQAAAGRVGLSAVFNAASVQPAQLAG